MRLYSDGAGLRQRALALSFNCCRLRSRLRGVAQRCPGLLQRGPGGSGPVGARPPDPPGAAVARKRHHHELGVSDGEVYRSLPTSLHDHSPREEPVEKFAHGAVPGASMQAEPCAAVPGRRRRARRQGQAGRPERDDSAGRPLAFEAGKAVAGCLLALHEHGGKGLPCRRLEGALVTFVDVDELHQGPEHAVDRRKPARTSACARLVECLGEGLRPSRPLVALSIGGPALFFGARQCPLRQCLAGVGLLDRSSNSHFGRSRLANHRVSFRCFLAKAFRPGGQGT